MCIFHDGDICDIVLVRNTFYTCLLTTFETLWIGISMPAEGLKPLNLLDTNSYLFGCSTCTHSPPRLVDDGPILHHQQHPKQPPPRRASAKLRAWGGGTPSEGTSIDCISQKGPLSNDSSSCQGRGDNSISYMVPKFPKSRSGFHIHQPRQNLEYLYHHMTTERCDPKMNW